MDGATAAGLKEKLNRLLKEVAQVSVDLDRADGTITGGPPLFRDRSGGLTNSDSSSVVRSKPEQNGETGRGADGHSPLPEMPSPLRAQLQETHG